MIPIPVRFNRSERPLKQNNLSKLARKKEKHVIPASMRTKKKTCAICGKRSFVQGKGCPNCGFTGPDRRTVTREQVREQLHHPNTGGLL